MFSEPEMAEQTREMIKTSNFAAFERDVAGALGALSSDRVIERIWKKDWTVWKKDPGQITNRLGWLTSPEGLKKDLSRIGRFVREVRSAGYTQALLLGMGGSSLAPLVLSSVFKTRPGSLDLEVLDSTDPAAVLHFARKLRPKKSLFIVSSKSGTTAETVSFFNFFWSRVGESLGKQKTGEHFIAITDPSTPLEEQARRLRFRSVFLGDPEIGGRFSALSVFGLVPAALIGIGIPRFLERAEEMARRCRDSADPRANPGAYLGTILGVLARRGRNKATFLLPRRLRTFGLWLEQLIAESTGKEGKGILPVEGEEIGRPDTYGVDRLFIHVKEKGGGSNAAALNRLKKAGFPVVSIEVPGAHSLGAQFFLWEFATAVAGYFLGVNPFDQPDVDSSKKKTQEVLAAFRAKGVLPEENPQAQEGGIFVFSDLPASTLQAGLKNLLAQARLGDYISIQAFLAPTVETARLLQRFRENLRRPTRLATTVGFGPRFLHSTGQLHKGDGGHGLFIQITTSDAEDVPVPDGPGSSGAAITFGVLKAAQARGDLEALKSAGRRVIRFHISHDTKEGLRRLASLPV